MPDLTALPDLVLDTNVALDWLVFDNPEVTPLRRAVLEASARWLMCPSMRQELMFVLGSSRVDAWSNKRRRALTLVDSLPCIQIDEPSLSRHLSLACTDPDDQRFIDLALAAPNRCLVTRDRALLKLARRAATRGTLVLTPVDWNARFANRGRAASP